MIEKTTLRSDQVRRYVNTTAYWNAHATVIPKEGDIYIYSDGASYEKDGDTVTVPRMKVGDGVRPLSRLPFVDDFQKGTLTIKRNNKILGSFPADSPKDTEINISVPVVVTTGSDDAAGIVFDMSPEKMQSEILSGACVMMKYREQIYYVGYCNGMKIPTIYGFSYDGNHTLQRLYIQKYDKENTVWKLEETSIPAVNDAILTVQKNGTTVDTFSANASRDKTIDITVPVRIGDLVDVFISEVSSGDILVYRAGKTNAFVNKQIGEIALPSSTKYAASISLSIDSSTYVVTAQLKDQDGNNIGAAQTIDLPLESVVVDGYYNSQTKKVVLTLENGSTIEFSVADLVAGLQSEITPQNPLSADLVVDGTANKVMTAAERAKLEGIEPGAEPNVGEVIYVGCDLDEGFIKCKLPPEEILGRINHGDCVMMLFESQVFHMAFAKKDTHPVVYGFTYDNARTLKRIYYNKDKGVKTQWFIEKIAIPVVPTNVSAFNNDMGYITGDDVPIEVISFYWSLTNTNYTSTLGPDVILHALEAGLCVIGLEKDSKDPTKTTVYQCMKYTHDEQKETYTLVFANVLNNEIQYFEYSSTSAKWTLSLVALQQKLYGNSGAGQNLKTINNTTLLGSGNINIHEGDDNVQPDWLQDDTSADDYIKNKPDITDEKITPEADNTSSEYPVILANAAIPSNGKPKYSSRLKATGTGDMIFEKDNTRCRIHYDDTDVSLKFMFK